MKNVKNRLLKYLEKELKSLDWKNILLFLSFAALAFVVTTTINLVDLDLWARLALGSIYYQLGTVIRHDIFTFVPTKELFVDHEWGSSVVFYFIAQRFNDIGLMVFKFFSVLAIFVIVYFIIKTTIEDKKFPVEPIYFLIFAKALSDTLDNPIRSEIFTFIFFAIWVLVLERIRKNNDFRPLWIMPATMLFWANAHGGFVAGFGLLFFYILGELLNSFDFFTLLKGKVDLYDKAALQRSGIFLTTLVISLISTFFNPYGIKNFWAFVFEATTMKRPDIIDWKPMPLFYTDPVVSENYAFWAYKLLLLFVIAVAIKAIIRKERPDFVKIIFFLVTIYLSIKHIRHDYFFYIATATIYPRYVDLLTPMAIWIRKQLPEGKEKFLPDVKYIISYLLIAVYCYGVFRFYNPHPLWVMVAYPDKYPVGSVEFLAQNNIKGRLLSEYGWGSYQFWKLYPNNLVAMDGRYEEVYGNDIYEKIKVFSEKKQGWQSVPEKISAEILIVPKATFSPEDVKQLKGWGVVYVDSCSVTLLKKKNIRGKYIYPDWRDAFKYWLNDLSKPVIL